MTVYYKTYSIMLSIIEIPLLHFQNRSKFKLSQKSDCSLFIMYLFTSESIFTFSKAISFRVWLLSVECKCLTNKNGIFENTCIALTSLRDIIYLPLISLNLRLHNNIMSTYQILTISFKIFVKCIFGTPICGTLSIRKLAGRYIEILLEEKDIFWKIPRTHRCLDSNKIFTLKSTIRQDEDYFQIFYIS